MLQNSRKELRSKFEVRVIELTRLHKALHDMQCCKHKPWHPWRLQANRSVSDTAAVKKLLAEGQEAASFIKTFVVQAKLNERGNFGEACFATVSCRASAGPISSSVQRNCYLLYELSDHIELWLLLSVMQTSSCCNRM